LSGSAHVRAHAPRIAGFALLVLALGPSAPSTPPVLTLSSDLRVRVVQGKDIELEVLGAESDTWDTLGARVGGGTETGTALGAWNRATPTPAGVWIRVPLALLDDDHRRLVLDSVFPEDRRDGEDWLHVVGRGAVPLPDAGPWQIALWFTGKGELFSELLQANGIDSPELSRGQELRIPARLLHRALRSGVEGAGGLLEYGSDAHGPFAAYRLKPGEALYTAVVLRFTGRTRASDVAEVAEEVARRNGIRDVRDIPAGYRVKIPLALLEPDFLPVNHPGRLAADAEQAEVDREIARAKAGSRRTGLEGVVVILDPGHGGRDLGTMNNGLWEHDYVYDVACRLKRNLEAHTAATVHLTLEDLETGSKPSTTDTLVANRQGTIATHPPFLAKETGEAQVGVNLRWYLANSIFRRAVASGTDPRRIAFVSLHADARHPSLAGVMAYVPGAGNVGPSHGSKGKPYMTYAEVREKPIVQFTREQLVRSQAMSTSLAQAVVRSFREARLPVQPYQPVRHRILRGKSVFVPAVLRGNEIPTKILVEMVNLSHRADAALLGTAAGRERMAQALETAVLRHFGGSPA
jgi:N-acetylmuramoyl-L-alanine amidase